VTADIGVNGGMGVLPAPVSVVISTRVKPSQEDAYRAWEQRIAAVQAKAPGFQGYRFEPPVSGVQDDWLAILRFDTDANLQAWLDSPQRQALLKEAGAFTEEFHTRIARTGFDQWFPVAAGEMAPPAWKQNMLVLLLLYPDRLPVRHPGADSAADRSLQPAIRHRSLHRQCGQRRPSQLSGAVVERPLFVVAAAGRQRAPDRPRRNRSCDRSLRAHAFDVLALVLGRPRDQPWLICSGASTAGSFMLAATGPASVLAESDQPRFGPMSSVPGG
jgi:hypothetical protein